MYTPGADAGSGVLRTTNGTASQAVRFAAVTGVSDFVRADSLTVEAGGGGRVLEVQDGAGDYNPPEALPAFLRGDATIVVRGVSLDDLNLAPGEQIQQPPLQVGARPFVGIEEQRNRQGWKPRHRRAWENQLLLTPQAL